MKKTDTQKIRDLIPHALGPDRRAARRTLNRLTGKHNRADLTAKQAQQLTGLADRLRTSVATRHARIKTRPVPEFPPELPITAKKDDITAAIRRNPVVIVSGETGSGKTTQIPKFCLAAGRGIDGLIGCTQPRRIAATTVARRIAEELGETAGQSVGYKIRFHEKAARDGYIKIMTDGVLLAEAQGDPWLNSYDTLIVDEAHERSLNIDFLLGILKKLLVKRKDLKLVITSATIDTEKFSKAFNNAPVIEVSGRMYPVDVRYLPADQDKDADEQSHIELAARAVAKIQHDNPFGDILVFMPTEQGIRETRELIEGRNYKGVTVMPLFARLTAAQQSRVFLPARGRKIIIATNIAETSITIPGIRYVVDTGLARISRYMPRSRTTALPVTMISKSSADQRMGRCGRVENGICYRLYAEEDYTSRPLYTSPEILRANLAEVILRMISLKLGNVETFPFIDPPAERNIKDGIDLLLELGAITSAKPKSRKKNTDRFQLTNTGRMMARLPIDPRLSRMLVAAREHGCVPDITVLAAALSIQDPRERPADHAQAADQAQKVFVDPLSDLVTLLNIWQQYHDTLKRKKTTGKMKKWCKA
ncbi:MAG: ATP-dependent RNA helicase HrpA, partial [Desulfobacterales bacterium]|nr:ATP-dependent RNA helicase HrpA [Desulfobacterales bacterium]